MQTYIDLHRHAAVRARLLDHPKVALRLMVAHAIAGSPLWSVRVEPQTARNEASRESVETCASEALFDARRRAVLGWLGFEADTPTVTRGNADGYGLVGVFLRLLALPDESVLEVLAVVMGETLMVGSAAVEAAGCEIGVDMAALWQADEAFFALIRDREVMGRIVADLAGEKVAEDNAKEKVKTLKTIARDCLEGANGRPRAEGWVPRWMAFPPSAYTPRGGVGTVAAHALGEAARADIEADMGGPRPDGEPVPVPDEAMQTGPAADTAAPAADEEANKLAA